MHIGMQFGFVESVLIACVNMCQGINYTFKCTTCKDTLT